LGVAYLTAQLLLGRVHPDEASQKAFGSVGGNLLDPSVREAAACAASRAGASVASAYLIDV